MIEFIKNNYQWIFSGVGISVLTLLYFVIRKLFRKKKTKNKSEVFNLLPDEIIKEMDKIPPLQRDKLKESYNGLRVEWKTKFLIANLSKNGNVHLMLLDRGNYPWICCDVKINDYPELKVVKEGAVIWISGEIIEVDGNKITVKPSSLRFVK